MLSPALTVLRGFVFPPVCEGCGAMTPASLSDPVCPRCAASLRPLDGPACRLCAQPRPIGGVCPPCDAERSALDAVYAAFAYDGALKSLLHAYKFGRRRPLGRFLGYRLALAAEKRLAGETFDAVVAVPADRAKAADRGFHPPAELARALARRLNIPDRSTWLGARAGRAQVSLTREERKRNVRGRFYFRGKPGEAAAQRVLLVDDVLTTGSTVSECAWTLQAAGAEAVSAICLAR